MIKSSDIFTPLNKGDAIDALNEDNEWMLNCGIVTNIIDGALTYKAVIHGVVKNLIPFSRLRKSTTTKVSSVSNNRSSNKVLSSSKRKLSQINSLNNIISDCRPKKREKIY